MPPSRFSRSSSHSSRKKTRAPGRASQPASLGLPPISLTIEKLGARGDGVAEWQGSAVFVPFTLPGDVVTALPISKKADGYTAALQTIEQPSADRVEPPCPAFGRCGGCSLQHLERAAEADWKRTIVRDALAHRGFEDLDTLVKATVATPAGERRRAVFGYRRLADRLVVGFNERASHQIIPLKACPVLTPELSELLANLETALAPWLPKGAQGDITVVASDSGVDMTLDYPANPDLAGREGLAAAAEQLDLARLSLRIAGAIEPLAARRTPVIRLGKSQIPLPSGAFLQPSRSGELALRDLVLQGLTGVQGAVADLFCGMGTFALPIAEAGHPVTAYDLEAIQTRPLHATGRVQAEARDLFRLPLMPDELAKFKALVMDPPRAGAQQQCEELATLARQSPERAPQRVVMVSCSPATFSRDARLLVDSGYQLTSVTPVDQFVWSAHVELVASFVRS